MIVDVLPAPFRLIALDRVGSTNDEARRLAEEGAAADFLVVSAREQSQGRGRRGRSWVSPAGNLHCSVVLAIPGALGQAAQLGFAAAVALVDALSAVVPAGDFRCKWPNDVWAGNAKIAGMLLEPAGAGWLVLGLGVNVVAAPPIEAVERPAVALADLGYGGDAQAVLAAFCDHFGGWVGRWRGEGMAPIREAWIHRARGLGQAIIVRLEQETVSGQFAGLDGDGALLLDQAALGVRRIMAGDVFFPAEAR